MFLFCLVPSSQRYSHRYWGTVVRPPKNCPWSQIRPLPSASPHRAINFQVLLTMNLSPLSSPQFVSLPMWICANAVKEVSLCINSGAATWPPQPLASLLLQFFGKGGSSNPHFNPSHWNTEKSSWEKVYVIISTDFTRVWLHHFWCRSHIHFSSPLYTLLSAISEIVIAQRCCHNRTTKGTKLRE